MYKRQVPLFIILSAVSPLFNPNGQTILFTYLGGRAYTLESLYYGMALAAMFISVIIWFASYNRVMTSDKFMYIFGRGAPSVSLVLSMILRLVPAFRRKIFQITAARKCVGKAGDTGTKKERLDNGMTVLSTLTTWALEGGIVTADSMRSRGYGTGRRTSFALYRFDRRDGILMALMTVLMIVILFCAFMGGTGDVYKRQILSTSISYCFYLRKEERIMLKNKNMKKWLSMLLMIAIMMTMIPSAAFAQSG